MVGSTLDHAEAMIGRIAGGEPFVSGWRLTFSHGHTIIYYNCGDDARILLDAPAPATPSLTTEFVPTSEFKQKSRHVPSPFQKSSAAKRWERALEKSVDLG